MVPLKACCTSDWCRPWIEVSKYGPPLYLLLMYMRYCIPPYSSTNAGCPFIFRRLYKGPSYFRPQTGLKLTRNIPLEVNMIWDFNESFILCILFIAFCFPLSWECTTMATVWSTSQTQFVTVQYLFYWHLNVTHLVRRKILYRTLRSIFPLYLKFFKYIQKIPRQL